MKKHIVLVALLLVPAGSGFGQIASYTFSATVKTVWGSSVYGTHPVVGDAITGFISYQTGMSNYLLTSTEMAYYQKPPYAFGFTVGGLTLESDAGYTLYVGRYMYAPDEVDQHFQFTDNDGHIKINGLVTNALNLQLVFDIRKLDAGLDLPPDFTDLGPMRFQHGEVSVFNNPGLSGLTFDLDSITVVPEPGATALMAMGTVLMAKCLRRRERLRPA